MYHWPIRNGTLHSSLQSTLDGQRILQMCQDHNCMKLEPIVRKLSRIENVSNVDQQDHQQYHQFLLKQTKPIREYVGLVEDQRKRKRILIIAPVPAHGRTNLYPLHRFWIWILLTNWSSLQTSSIEMAMFPLNSSLNIFQKSLYVDLKQIPCF